MPVSDIQWIFDVQLQFIVCVFLNFSFYSRNLFEFRNDYLLFSVQKYGHHQHHHRWNFAPKLQPKTLILSISLQQVRKQSLTNLLNPWKSSKLWKSNLPSTKMMCNCLNQSMVMRADFNIMVFWEEVIGNTMMIVIINDPLRMNQKLRSNTHIERWESENSAF